MEYLISILFKNLIERSTEMAKKYKKITYQDRKDLELYIKSGIISPEILALRINVHIATLYRELERGRTEDGGYSADLAQQRLFS